jgi:hypothetical protein
MRSIVGIDRTTIGCVSESFLGYASAEPNLVGKPKNSGQIKGMHGRDESRQDGAVGARRHATAAKGLLRYCIYQ